MDGVPKGKYDQFIEISLKSKGINTVRELYSKCQESTEERTINLVWEVRTESKDDYFIGPC